MSSTTSRAAYVFVAIATIATVAVALQALFHVSLGTYPGFEFTAVQGYYFQDKGMLGTGVLVAAIFALPPCVRMVTSASPPKGSLVLGVTALVVLGIALQHGMALAEHRGWSGMRDRLLPPVGHAEFVHHAGKLDDSWSTLRDYERIAKEGGGYLRSKPPGQLLFYMLTADIADVVVPARWASRPPVPSEIETDREWRLIQVAALLYPVLSMLVLFPITYLALVLAGRGLALWPPLLYVLCPAVQLITLHLDQAVYPLLVTTVWAFAVRAVRERRHPWAWWAAAGAVASVALFISFSVLPGLALAAPFAWLASPPGDNRRVVRALLVGGLVAMGVVVILTLALTVTAGYDPLHAFRRSLENHRHTKHWTESMRWPAAGLNLFQFSYWVGPPIIFAFYWQSITGIWAAARRRLQRDTLLAMATFAILLVTAVFGSTVGEVARLWLFLVPAVVIASAQRFGLLTAGRGEFVALSTAALQIGWMFCLKALEDFA